MAINDPRPAPGTAVVCIPVEEHAALLATTGEVFLLASAVYVLEAPGVPPDLAKALRTLALAVCNRLQAMPAAVIAMPGEGGAE